MIFQNLMNKVAGSRSARALVPGGGRPAKARASFVLSLLPRQAECHTVPVHHMMTHVPSRRSRSKLFYPAYSVFPQIIREVARVFAPELVGYMVHDVKFGSEVISRQRTVQSMLCEIIEVHTKNQDVFCERVRSPLIEKTP